MGSRALPEIRKYRVVLQDVYGGMTESMVRQALAKEHCRAQKVVDWETERSICYKSHAPDGRISNHCVEIVMVRYTERPRRYKYLAHFTASNGVITCQGKPVFIFRSGKDNVGKLESPEGVHLGMWIQSGGPCEVMPAGRRPFKAVFDEMNKLERSETRKALKNARENLARRVFTVMAIGDFSSDHPCTVELCCDGKTCEESAFSATWSDAKINRLVRSWNRRYLFDKTQRAAIIAALIKVRDARKAKGGE